MNDGIMLKDDENEQETVVQKKVVFSEKTSALSPAVSSENNVSATGNSAPLKFQPVGDLSNQREIKQVEPFTFPHLKNQQQTFNETAAFQPPKFTPPNASGQNGASAKSNKNLLLITGVLFGAIIVAGIVWFTSMPNPLESKLDKAISNNKLFEPAGENAYELYHQLKKEGADAKILKKFEDRLFPMLTEKTPEILKTVTEPGVPDKDLGEWQNAAKMLEWASEIQPQDSQIAAKAAYCKGRVNYLTENKQAAIEDWKKAADLDKKWALPLNGIGLIYNELKNYETARTFLQKAIDREPVWAFPYNNFGTSYYNQKRFAEALPYYQKAAEISPRWARTHAWLASVAKETGDYTACVAELEKVFAPDAIGASDLKLDEIRRKKQECENLSAYSYYGY
jgi:tetratricopeptide (TPR) repeat protein